MRQSDLSRPERDLVRVMQTINFGRISLRVQGGEPDQTQAWRTLRTVKLATGSNGPRPEARTADFELRAEQVALLDQLSQLQDGTSVTIEVRHGLPFLIEIMQDHQVA